jgi:hypothetical protein
MRSSFNIVASQIVRDDVALGNVISEANVDRDGLLSRASVFLAEDADLSRVVRSPFYCLGDRSAEDVATVEVEQLARLRHPSAAPSS